MNQYYVNSPNFFSFNNEFSKVAEYDFDTQIIKKHMKEKIENEKKNELLINKMKNKINNNYNNNNKNFKFIPALTLNNKYISNQNVNYNFSYISNNGIQSNYLKTYNGSKIIYNNNILKNFYEKTKGKNNNNNIDLNLIIQEQEKKDKIKKDKIINTHSTILSNYYDYSTYDSENEINQLLEDINFYGDYTKKQIEKIKQTNNDKYISIEEAMKLGNNVTNNKCYKNEYFVLGVLAQALKIEGCSVLIEKDKTNNEEEIKEINTTIQFLVNGMYNFKKYIFYFNFEYEKIRELFYNINERNNFNMRLKKELLSIFELLENDIVMTNPHFDSFNSYSITFIIKKSNFKEYSSEELLKYMIYNTEFKNIKNIEKTILLTGCKLNPYMLDARGNNKDGGWGFNEMRGGNLYYPPEGWVGYGVRVVDRFDKGNNAWLGYNNTGNEWSVAYHGIAFGGSIKGNNTIKSQIKTDLKKGIGKQFKNSNDAFHIGQKVGEGVYVTPFPKYMEKYCGEFFCCGKSYKIGFMTRVMPKRIRCPEEKKYIWVINGTDNEIRPYRILIKEN